MSGWTGSAAGDRLTPADFVALAARLLDAAVAATDGQASTRRAMVEGLREILTVDQPASTLRLDVGRAPDRARGELTAQAVAVADVVVDLVEAQPPADVEPFDLRSHCVGYQWTQEVTSLLLRPDRHAARNLYNEWQWQLVLLRDLLLPFVDPRPVLLAVGPTGLHHAADGRDAFVTRLMTRRVAHADVVALAALATGGPTAPGAFGFTQEGAAVLPAVLSSTSLDEVPSHLLAWEPGRPELPVGVALVPAEEDQLAAAREPVSAAPRRLEDVDVVDIASHLSTAPVPADADRGGVPVDLVVGFDEHVWRVDLGQSLRGHRYAIRPAADAGTGDDPVDGVSGGSVGGARGGAADHAFSGCAYLRGDGDTLVRPTGTQLVPTGGQRDLGLAVLGRSTPGDVVLYRGQSTADLVRVHGPDLVLLDLRP